MFCHVILNKWIKTREKYMLATRSITLRKRKRCDKKNQQSVTNELTEKFSGDQKKI